MKNPINNSVFDSRDLIEYKEYLESELVTKWNEQENAEEFQADGIDDIFDTSGHEYADNAKELFADFEADNEDEVQEYMDICDFIRDLESYSSDFNYGETIIHEDYFTEYAEQMVKDCGYISNDLPSWIEIDWESTAGNVMGDYRAVNYNGDTYYIR